MFYRVHWDSCPEFSPENAQSMTWAGRKNLESDCLNCGGEGEVYRADGRTRECSECDGTGTVKEEAEAGYSCCNSFEELQAYFSSRGEPDDAQRVVIFDGEEVGNGYDCEPLVIPTSGTETWTTWGELKASL